LFFRSDAGSALENFYTAYLASPVLLAVSSVLCAVLMVLPLPLIALKFQGLSFSENAMRYVLIGMAVLLLLIFAVKAIPIILLLYIGISMVDHLRNSPHGLQSRN
jgi:CDP-diacylglycerol--serine O-phosphatidyltransferase